MDARSLRLLRRRANRISPTNSPHSFGLRYVSARDPEVLPSRPPSVRPGSVALPIFQLWSGRGEATCLWCSLHSSTL